MEQWYVHCKKADFASISAAFGISPMLARILRNRDIISMEDIAKYLNGSIRDMYDPFLLKGMKEGVELTADKIRKGRKIRIIGDYDVDGICSGYILESYLSCAGAIVDVRLPNRIHEGYGMNTNMVEEAAEDGISLIITCDNGISAIDAVKLARRMGIDVIVTDHHEPAEELPDANFIIDAKQKGCSYPFKEICGGAVAYKFVQALDAYMGLGNNDILDVLLQFAGMATIADIVPLVDENRIFAAEGIKRLKITDNTGLNALLNVRKMDPKALTSGSIGFVIGPCINSAGRMDDPELALRLFKEQDMNNALEIAGKLSSLNEMRKNLTFEQCARAMAKLKEKEESNTLEKVLIVYLPQAHESVAGIIAGRIKEEFNRPSIVITQSEGGLKGSGRSTDRYNMIEGLRKHGELFEKCGGHSKACGFSLKNNGSEEHTVEELSKALNSSCELQEADLTKEVWIDMLLPFKYINEVFTEELSRLEPFGMKNEKPVFAQNSVSVISASIIGKNNNVLKMQLQDTYGCIVDGIYFGDETNVTEQFEKVSCGKKISILYYPDINEFRGRKTPQAAIKAIRVCE